MTDTIDRPQADGDRVLDHLIVRFAGDSGDGMQLTGDRFTSVSASFGNDLSTMPDFPAEIRAPAGTVNGVSAFQVNIADHDITTPGDDPNVLVAMNPAALKADLHRLEPGGTVIVNEDAFEERNLEKAGYLDAGGHTAQPARRRHPERIPSVEGSHVEPDQEGVRAARSQAPRRRAIEELLRTRTCFMDVHASDRADRGMDSGKVRQERKGCRCQQGCVPAGFNFGETTEAVGHRFEVRPANCLQASTRASPATRHCRGDSSPLVSRPTFRLTLGSYPITPASDILHELSKHKHFGIRTVQAEDEIAAVGVALGARSPATWQSPPPAVPVWRSRARRSRWHSPSNCH